MDKEKVSQELLELLRRRHNSDVDRELFRRFVESMPYDQMEKLIEGETPYPDGLQIIRGLFEGLSLDSKSQKKRAKLFVFLLKEIQETELPPRSLSSLLTCLVFEVNKLSPAQLVQVSDLCVDYVSKTTVPQRACWLDVLPKVLDVLSKIDELDHYGSEMSGIDYKKLVVSSICQAKWDPAVLTPIAAMFLHIPLSPEEHSRVVSKICSSIEFLSSDEIPPLVHQTLQLTHAQNALPLFFALKKYFNSRIYKLNDSSGMLDTERVQMLRAVTGTQGTEPIEVSLKDVTESESMVLYHVEEAARLSNGSTTELVKAVKSSVCCGEAMTDPFLLAVLLIVSSYQPQLLDIVKSTLTRLVQEEERRRDSDWLRKVLNNHCDLEGAITKLIRSNACELGSVLKGLVNLSLTLLKSPVKLISHYGRMVATNLVVKHALVSATLMNSITSEIICNPDVVQYADCLDEICDSSPLLVVEEPRICSRLLESLFFLKEGTAAKIIYALISLVRVSSRVRDNLLLTLRKALFRNELNSRKLAVSGFLQLLKSMKIKGMYSLSQNTFQAYTCPSVLTQTLLEVHSQSNAAASNNEGVCLEVIQILRRCFSYQIPVKIAFYSGLQSALLKNPELCIPVVDIFLAHINTFFEPDEEIIPPFNFSKAILSQTDIVVVEPLGHLVHAVQQIMSTSDKRISGIVDDDSYIANRQKLTAIFESVTRRFSKMQLKHLNVEENMDGSIDSRFREERLWQCLTIYQALFSYLIDKIDWDTSEDDAKMIVNVVKSYSVMEDCAKVSKKEERKKNKDATLPPAVKKVTTPSETVLEFETILRSLSLILNDSVDWCPTEAAAPLKSRASVHRFAFQMTAELLAKTKSRLAVRRSKISYDDLTSLAKLLFDRVLCRFDTVNEFDTVAAISGLELFTESCSLLYQFFKRKNKEFLISITGSEEDLSLDGLLEKVLTHYLSTLSTALEANETEEGDPDHKRLVDALISGVNQFSLELPVDGVAISRVYTWLMDIAQTNPLISPGNAKTLMSLLFKLLGRAKSEAALHDNIALQLCHVFGPITQKELEKCTVKLAIVNDSTKTVVYSLLVSALSSRLDCVNWVINRLKAELFLINQPDAFQTDPISRRGVLKRKENELVTELGLICSVCQWLCTCAIDMSSAEIVCRLLHQLYSSLVLFTKFGKLVKLAASHLSSQITDFLLYVESRDIEEEDDVPTKKVTAKVLRQAKKQIVYIPKLVTELENFTKCVTQLSTKTKDPTLVSKMKLTVTRDFRLNTKKIEEAFKRGHPDEDENDVSVDASTSAQPTQMTQPTTQPPKETKQSQPKKRVKLLKKRKTT